MQPTLGVETRAEQLERQHRLLIEIASVERQIAGYKGEIKMLKDELDGLEAQLSKVTTDLEANQVTLSAK